MSDDVKVEFMVSKDTIKMWKLLDRIHEAVGKINRFRQYPPAAHGNEVSEMDELCHEWLELAADAQGRKHIRLSWPEHLNEKIQEKIQEILNMK